MVLHGGGSGVSIYGNLLNRNIAILHFAQPDFFFGTKLPVFYQGPSGV